MTKGLILDDESTFVEELQEFLSLNGIACVGMTDPYEAYDYLIQASTKVSFVVLDLKMPGFVGREVIQFIRQAIPETTRVALVSGDRESITALGIAASCSTQLFHKPIDAEALLHYLRMPSDMS